MIEIALQSRIQIRIMSSTRQSICQALREIRLIDPHSHINPHQPASTTLADILGYHYYTELVHSAGTPKHAIESPGLSPRELVGTLVTGLPHLSNTAQHAWLIDICKRFFGFEEDVINESNWEALFDKAESTMALADWADVVLEKSNVEAVFLTNDFDDDLQGFDTKTYIPCLRTDELVFHLSKIEVRDRLTVCTGIDIDGSLTSLRHALEQRFEHFVSHGARACAISLPPDFSPSPVSDGRASTALDAVIRMGTSADTSHKSALAKRVFWTIVELCDQFRLPMDLMIGVNRGVYQEGVYQGRDLYDSRVSLIQYRELFNAFPDVKFPISVLASVTNQELVSYAWIFPNVITNGHWWYSNTPSFIRRDAAARLEAVPRNKQIGYYSDAYKLEFIAPKFDMYRNILAGILTDDFVMERGWSEEKAIELGRQILRGNVDTVFPDLAAPQATAWQTTSISSAAPKLETHLSLDHSPNLSSKSGDDLAATASLAAPFAGALVASNEMLPSEEVFDEVAEVCPVDAVESVSPVDVVDESRSQEITDWEDDEIESGYSTLIDLASVPIAKQPPSAEPAVPEHAEPEHAEPELAEPTPAPWIEDEPLELPREESNEVVDGEPNVFNLLDSNDDSPQNARDPYSTLELDKPWAAAPVAELPEDEPIMDRADATNTNDDEPLSRLYADPSTGELKWPTSTLDDDSLEAIEEMYLLPDESTAFDATKTVSSELSETIDIVDPPSNAGDWFKDSDEPAEAIAATVELTDEVPEYTDEASVDADLELIAGFADDHEQADLTENTDHRYFRADDEPIANPAEASTSTLDEPAIGLYADPNTGELKWPTSSLENEATDSIEESYLLPEESSIFDATKTDSSELGETIDFDELELTPIEEDDPSMFYGDEATEDLFAFDPEQATDFIADDQAPDAKQD